MEGFGKRVISRIKKCMKKTISKASLSFDELQTVLYEVELIINSHPLDHIYDDDTEVVITPNHLLFGRQLESHNITNEEFDVRA